jgi:hypothetical protein
MADDTPNAPAKPDEQSPSMKDRAANIGPKDKGKPTEGPGGFTVVNR